LAIINALNLVSLPIGSMDTVCQNYEWQPSEESIIVQYTFPYNDRFHVKNGSFQSKLKEPAIEMVSSTSLKVLMEAR
jgi:hypothetical protein